MKSSIENSIANIFLSQKSFFSKSIVVHSIYHLWAALMEIIAVGMRLLFLFHLGYRLFRFFFVLSYFADEQTIRKCPFLLYRKFYSLIWQLWKFSSSICATISTCFQRFFRRTTYFILFCFHCFASSSIFLLRLITLPAKLHFPYFFLTMCVVETLQLLSVSLLFQSFFLLH